MKNVVIAGAGHGAGQVVASLRQKNFAGNITMLGEEPWYPYQRPPLSKKFLAGELPAERLYFKPQSFYDEPNISVLLDTRVTAIDRDKKCVATAAGDCFDYDHLVIATGSRPRQLDLPGADLGGVHYLRGIDDVDAIRGDMSPGRRMTIIGAGYIGLEVATRIVRILSGYPYRKRRHTAPVHRHPELLR
jgi:3-phenylpropionate/trans-cinnamate dioxygenase ferredoxin reductase subunit